MNKKRVVPPELVLFFGIMAISASAILIRFAQDDVPSLVIAAWRMIIASLILLPICLSQRRYELQQMSRQQWGWAFVSGGMLALHFGSWISSLAYTSVASSTVLVATSPLWVALVAPVFLKESLTTPLKMGIGLALLGGFWVSAGDALMQGTWAAGLGSNPLLGNGLALVGALAAAVYFVIGRRLRPYLSLLTYTTVVYGTAALFLLGTALIAGQSFWGYPPNAYFLFLLMAIFPQLLGHSSYNWALGLLPAAFVTVTVLAEPIGASFLALLFFQEIPTEATILGGVLILAGIVVANRRREKTK